MKWSTYLSNEFWFYCFCLNPWYFLDPCNNTILFYKYMMLNKINLFILNGTIMKYRIANTILWRKRPSWLVLNNSKDLQEEIQPKWCSISFSKPWTYTLWITHCHTFDALKVSPSMVRCSFAFIGGWRSNLHGWFG